ncbi:hypothetical protein Peur_005919 [Populus x canadensis]
MAFLPCGSGTRSQVLFLCRASISSCIAVIHIDTSVLLIASWKVDSSPSSIRRQYAMLLSVTYSECQAGGLLSRVDRRTSGVSDSICSCSSCSGAASEEVRF